MPIRDLCVTNVGPFNDIMFEFDTHINVFVGPNSSGKSTALMALADIAAYPYYAAAAHHSGPPPALSQDANFLLNALAPHARRSPAWANTHATTHQPGHRDRVAQRDSYCRPVHRCPATAVLWHTHCHEVAYRRPLSSGVASQSWPSCLHGSYAFPYDA
jgi:AAA domain